MDGAWCRKGLHEASLFCRKTTSGVVEQLLKERPQDAKHQDENGHLPLHLASMTPPSSPYLVKSTKVKENIIEQLIDAHPSGMLCGDLIHGDTPLHLASRLLHWSAIRVLTQHHHDPLHMNNRSNSSGNNNESDSCCCLVTRQNNDGCTPMHLLDWKPMRQRLLQCRVSMNGSNQSDGNGSGRNGSYSRYCHYHRKANNCGGIGNKLDRFEGFMDKVEFRDVFYRSFHALLGHHQTWEKGVLVETDFLSPPSTSLQTKKKSTSKQKMTTKVDRQRRAEVPGATIHSSSTTRSSGDATTNRVSKDAAVDQEACTNCCHKEKNVMLIKDHMGQVPLHKFCGLFAVPLRFIGYEIFYQLSLGLEACPEAAGMPDDNGDYPLHLMLAWERQPHQQRSSGRMRRVGRDDGGDFFDDVQFFNFDNTFFGAGASDGRQRRGTTTNETANAFMMMQSHRPFNGRQMILRSLSYFKKALIKLITACPAALLHRDSVTQLYPITSILKLLMYYEQPSRDKLSKICDFLLEIANMCPQALVIGEVGYEEDNEYPSISSFMNESHSDSNDRLRRIRSSLLSEPRINFDDSDDEEEDDDEDDEDDDSTTDSSTTTSSSSSSATRTDRNHKKVVANPLPIMILFTALYASSNPFLPEGCRVLECETFLMMAQQAMAASFVAADVASTSATTAAANNGSDSSMVQENVLRNRTDDENRMTKRRSKRWILRRSSNHRTNKQDENSGDDDDEENNKGETQRRQRRQEKLEQRIQKWMTQKLTSFQRLFLMTLQNLPSHQTATEFASMVAESPSPSSSLVHLKTNFPQLGNYVPSTSANPSSTKATGPKSSSPTNGAVLLMPMHMLAACGDTMFFYDRDLKHMINSLLEKQGKKKNRDNSKDDGRSDRNKDDKKDELTTSKLTKRSFGSSSSSLLMELDPSTGNLPLHYACASTSHNRTWWEDSLKQFGYPHVLWHSFGYFGGGIGGIAGMLNHLYNGGDDGSAADGTSTSSSSSNQYFITSTMTMPNNMFDLCLKGMERIAPLQVDTVQAVRTRNIAGELPLHIVLKKPITTQQCLDRVQTLIEIDPESVTKVHPPTNLYPFMLAAVLKNIREKKQPEGGERTRHSDTAASNENYSSLKTEEVVVEVGNRESNDSPTRGNDEKKPLSYSNKKNCISTGAPCRLTMTYILLQKFVAAQSLVQL